ncbi:MAG: HIG1 domain-containing protein [Alphaproteobacteria bacterium]
MNSTLGIVVLVLMGLTALVLIVGIGLMARGGEASRKYGNKLMALRVVMQSLTLAAFALFVLTKI